MNNTFETIYKGMFNNYIYILTQFVLKYFKHFLHPMQILIQKVILVYQAALLTAILSMIILHKATKLK